MENVQAHAHACKITTIDGRSVRVNGDGVPRILDAELATDLGFKQARDIRKLIKRAFPTDAAREAAGIVEVVTTRTQVMPRGGVKRFTVREFWLPEEAALEVTVQCQTPTARETRRKVIAVFLAWRRGTLVPAKPARKRGPSQLAMVLPMLAALAESQKTLAAMQENTAASLRDIATQLHALAREPRPLPAVPPPPPPPPEPALTPLEARYAARFPPRPTPEAAREAAVRAVRELLQATPEKLALIRSAGLASRVPRDWYEVAYPPRTDAELAALHDAFVRRTGATYAQA